MSDFGVLGNLHQSLNIQNLLMKLEGFRYATSLDLTMGYYHNILCLVSLKIYTIV